MLSEKKIAEVIGEGLRRIYRETEPVGDIDKIKESGEGKMEQFFMAYYLDDERQKEIIDELVRELKVPKWQHKIISSSIVLGASPCGNKETSIKYRKTHEKRLKKHLEKLNGAQDMEKEQEEEE